MRHEDVVQELSDMKTANIETKTLASEIGFLKKELKRVMEADENKDKAMEDLALALKEVVAESRQVKEKLISTEQTLEAVREEAANLKEMVKWTQGTYESVLKENEQLANIVDRLRLEAEESVLAWSSKEIEFVKCIKEIEDENNKLTQSLKEAKKPQEESKKLRDILKQALNEANVAKEAANLARTENSYLKDSLAEKNKALVELAHQSDHLRSNEGEGEANESIIEPKRIFPSGSKKEGAQLEMEIKEIKKTHVTESGDKIPPAYGCSSRNDGAYEGLDNLDEMDMKRSSQGKKRALLRRFGDILRRSNSQSQSQSQSPKKEAAHPQKKMAA